MGIVTKIAEKGVILREYPRSKLSMKWEKYGYFYRINVREIEKKKKIKVSYPGFVKHLLSFPSIPRKVEFNARQINHKNKYYLPLGTDPVMNIIISHLVLIPWWILSFPTWYWSRDEFYHFPLGTDPVTFPTWYRSRDEFYHFPLGTDPVMNSIISHLVPIPWWILSFPTWYRSRDEFYHFPLGTDPVMNSIISHLVPIPWWILSFPTWYRSRDEFYHFPLGTDPVMNSIISHFVMNSSPVLYNRPYPQNVKIGLNLHVSYMSLKNRSVSKYHFVLVLE